jgi:hypothetical protein
MGVRHSEITIKHDNFNLLAKGILVIAMQFFVEIREVPVTDHEKEERMCFSFPNK